MGAALSDRKRPFAARSPEKVVALDERRQGAGGGSAVGQDGSAGVRTRKFLPNVLEVRIDSNVAWKQRTNDEGAKALVQVLNRLEDTLRQELGRDPFGDEVADAIVASIHVNFGV